MLECHREPVESAFADGSTKMLGRSRRRPGAVERARGTRPDVFLLDIAMPGLGGLESVPLLRREVPGAHILILTQYEQPEYVRRFLHLGVTGYVLTKAGGAELITAIRAVHRGGSSSIPPWRATCSATGPPERRR